MEHGGREAHFPRTRKKTERTLSERPRSETDRKEAKGERERQQQRVDCGVKESLVCPRSSRSVAKERTCGESQASGRAEEPKWNGCARDTEGYSSSFSESG